MVKKWEIFFCHLDPTIGSEQRGTRPVIVISNDTVNQLLNISTVLPITGLKSNDSLYPSQVLLPMTASGLPKDSVVLCHQIKTVSHERFIRKVGQLSDPDLQEKITEALRVHLEL